MVVPTYETTCKDQELIISRLEKENQKYKKAIDNIKKICKNKYYNGRMSVSWW